MQNLLSYAKFMQFMPKLCSAYAQYAKMHNLQTKYAQYAKICKNMRSIFAKYGPGTLLLELEFDMYILCQYRLHPLCALQADLKGGSGAGSLDLERLKQ